MARHPLEATVDHYLTEWGTAGWAHAFHGLIELGPAALPVLIERFESTPDPALRAELLEIARRQRSARAVAFFRSGLAQVNPRVWKAALDGLVNLATPEAIDVLEGALRSAPARPGDAPEFRAWVKEALDQAREAATAREEDGS